MATWTDMLDSLEVNLNRMDHALRTERWDQLEIIRITDWATDAPTPDELERFEVLSARAQQVEVDIRDAMAAIQGEFGSNQQVRQATRSYVAADKLAR